MSEEAKDTGREPPAWLLKAFTRLHVALHRLSGGRLFNRLGGDEVCFVTMTGAKTGKRRTVPLMYVPYEDGLLLVASKGGAPTHPVWYHNLVAHPEIEVVQRGSKMRLTARPASPEEKEHLWPVCYEHYAPYEQYRQRTSRDIPIFVCEPAG